MRARLLPLLFLAACGPSPCLSIEEVADLCDTHPFGPAIACGPEEEPQTSGKCEEVLGLNPGLCVTEYVACREALRVAGCGVCPRECEGLVGVVECDVAEDDPTG